MNTRHDEAGGGRGSRRGSLFYHVIVRQKNVKKVKKVKKVKNVKKVKKTTLWKVFEKEREVFKLFILVGE